MAEFRRCARCVMDNNSDVTITFDEKGNCDYCTAALASNRARWTADQKSCMLDALVSKMRHTGRRSKYDCIMGLSGGLDSSYLALLAHQWGLRVLTIHVDDGFDSDISKKNISALVAATGFDYVTITPDPQQFNALTAAYIRAQVPNIAAPQDNILFASLYRHVRDSKIHYFASGANHALESILQRGNTHHPFDVTNLRDINNRFGHDSLNRLPLTSTVRRAFEERLSRLKTVAPLDLVDYRREDAFSELSDFCGFEYYGGKHLENRLTEFAQLYWFYHKFGVDKRTSHLSSLIVSNQMTRSEAIKALDHPVYDKQQMEECIAVVCDRLGIERNELDRLLAAPGEQHTAYATEGRTWWFRTLERTLQALSKIRSVVTHRG